MELNSLLSDQISFRDSAKVHRQVILICLSLEGELATLRSAGGTGLAVAVSQARERTLDSISEVYEHAATIEKILAKGGSQAV